MSVEQLAVVLHHSKMRGTRKLVMVGVANHDGDGGAWPTIKTLAKYTNVADRNVQEAIADCVASGELRVHYNEGGNHRTNPDERPNLYEILVTCPPGCSGGSRHEVTPPVTESSPPPVTESSPKPSLGTVLEPSSLTASATPPRGAPGQASLLGDDDLSSPAETEGQRVNRLTRTYTDAEGMHSFGAVQGVVRKAVKTGEFTDQEIIDALARLRADNRPVTIDTLRIELRGMTRSLSAARPTAAERVKATAAATRAALAARENRPPTAAGGTP